jgi:amidohydrolase
MIEEQVIEWRRHLHRHPEPSFAEHETARFVAETLESLGVATERPTSTSVVGRLGSGPAIALRADIDALPIAEESGVDFASTRPGFMHACGHDGHTAMLLGAAKQLAEDPPPGHEIRFIFQHAEELAPGGAKDLVDAGVMDGVRFVYGCHLWTPLEYGKVVARPGPFMAAADFFRLTIRGKGGHAGLPHTADDTVVAAAAVVTELQHVVARRIDPLQPAVVTIGSFHAGDAPNVIPGEAVLTGTTRSFDPEVRARLPRLIEETAALVAQAHGATAELDFQFGYKPVVNDPDATRVVQDAIGDRLTELDPIMGGDDFSAYLEHAPGCYAFIGAGGEYPHHHPRFKIDERALAIGTRLHVEVARRSLRLLRDRPDPRPA